VGSSSQAAVRTDFRDAGQAIESYHILYRFKTQNILILLEKLMAGEFET